MSTSIYKVPYVCDCGVDHGDCSAECAVILKSHNTCDVYTLYHTDSHPYKGNDRPKTEEGGLVAFGDAYLEALNKAINLPECNIMTLTDSERAVVFEEN